MYGYGCPLAVDELWQPEQVRTADLRSFVEESEQKGAFRLGEGDLHIEDSLGTLMFTSCHESDIHFESTQPAFVDEVVASWGSKGFALYLSSAPKGSASARDWRRIDPSSKG